MLSHDRVWAAIDALAARHGMTASGLARKAGLDATSFNKSKRTSPEGRDRWPSTESISKILRATGATLEDFLRLVEPSGSLAPLHGPADRHDAGRVGQVLHRGGPADRRAGLGRDRLSGFRPGEGLRPGGHGRLHGAALSRRRRSDRLADGQHPQGRPHRRAHHERRDPGQGAQAPLGQDPRTDVARPRSTRTG